MSGYYDDDAPRRHRSHRSSRPVYEEEEVYRGRVPPPRQKDMVRHRDSSSDSVEEIPRNFPHGDGSYTARRVKRREKYAPRASSVGRDEYYDDRRAPRRDKRRRRDSYSDSSDSYSRSPPPRRRQSLGEQALAALGIGGAAAGAANAGRSRRDRDRYDDRNARSYSRGRHRRGYSSSRSRSRSVDQVKKWQQAAKAAGTAAVLEAWKSRKEPGGVTGSGKRIMTAAIGAAGVNGALDRDPGKSSKRHVLESAIGGLASNRLINGRSQSRSRSRGRDKSGPGLGGIASAAGLAAVAAKGLKKYRSKSRDREKDRGRGRRDSYSSYSSDEPPKRSRSKSISRYLNAGMAKLGLTEDGNKGKSSRRHYSDDDEYYNPRPRGGDLPASTRKKIQQHGSDTDSYSSSEEERKLKKGRGKEILTAGLATVATVHAGHNVYQSYNKRALRHKKLLEGEITAEQAKKARNKDRLSDAASIGIAALGIKSAFSEMKELKESVHEFNESKHRLEEKREHRRAKMLEAAKQQSEPNLRSKYSDGQLPPPPMGGSRH